MNLPGSLYLGWRYLRRQRVKTLLLVAALTLAIFLPAGVTVFVREAEDRLRSRADSTPLVLGAPGSQLELVFNGLYFSKPEVARLSMRDAEAARGDGLAQVIPIYARYSAKSFRIVGTSIDYFRFRNLKPREGRLISRLGECVIGSEVAAELGIGPGDSLVSTPEAVFDLAGVYPLRMRVTGVLEPAGGPDDRAVFVDTRTAWVIEGLAHGHQDAREADPNQVLERDESGNVALNASVVEYTEITPDNVDSFHFHGDPGDFPISAAIVIPRDEKARTILLGRYQDASGQEAQLAEPAVVMDELFDTVFQVRTLVVAALALVAVAAGLISLLVFLLSNRLRAREFESLRNIGADPGSIRMLILFEGTTVIAFSVVVSLGLIAGLKAAAPWLVRMLTG